MAKTLLSLSRLNLLVGLVAAVLASSVGAQEKLLTPPYLITGFDTIVTGVTWDEAAVRGVLPAGITPTKEMSGGINIYQANGGFGLGAYTAAYLWVDIEGHDAPDGTKGRWMLTGVYGPSAKVVSQFEEFYGLPIRSGGARHEEKSGVIRAIGSHGGQDLVAVEVKVDSSKCQPGGGRVNFLSNMPRTGQIIEFSPVFWGEVCPAEVMSAKLTAPAGDPFARFPLKKVNWSIQFKGSVAIPPPFLRP